MSARVTYVGHGEALIDLAGTRLLTDPVHRDTLLAGAIRRIGAAPAPEISAGIDAVLISHAHPDHLDFPTLRDIPGAWRLIAPAGTAALFRRRGFERTEELRPGDSAAVGDVRITATPADHDGRRWKLGRRDMPALGFEIAGAGRSLYVAGDTDLFPEMADLGGQGLDLALLPISGWGPRITGKHLDPHRAAAAAALIRPRVVVPIHWGTFLRRDLVRRRPELGHRPAPELVAHMADLAPQAEARVLEPGASMEL